MARLILAALLLLSWGCDDDDGAAEPKDGAPDAASRDMAPADAAEPDGAAPNPCPFETHQIGDWVVEVADGPWRVIPPHGGDPVLSSGPCESGDPSIRLGSGEPEVQSGFGAFRVTLDTLTWTPIEAAGPAIELDGDSLRLRWERGALSFTARDGGLFVAVETDADAAELSWFCGRDDGYFGLGTQVTGLNLRGRTYPLFTQEQGIGKPDDGVGFPLANTREAAYAPMGVWHASTGHAAIIGHDRFSELDVCHRDGNRVALRSLGEPPSFLLVPGADPKARMRAVSDVVGRMRMPPPWVFAPWNDAVGGPERLHEVADRLREAGIPSSAIWSEDWIGGEQTDAGFRLSYAWEWDPTLYPDLAADIASLHARGFAFLGYFNPFVPEPTRMWTEGIEGDFLIKNGDGEVVSFLDPAFRNASLVDLTNPDARAWLDGYLTQAVTELGIDGWMADFAEWMPLETRTASGETGWEVHNRYPLDWQRANREAMERARPDGNYTFFVRSGWASTGGGTGGIAPTLWGGDQDTDWDRDDGLPTVLSIAVNVGLAGVAVFGSDIAGYSSFARTPNTTKELFYRWATLGAFHPLMRTHHGSDECGNWAFDRDAETLAHYRRWATVHTLLYPEWRALAQEAVDVGLPISRHPHLVAPDRPALWREATDQLFIGDDLLVAPVVEPGATGRTVWLPDAGWWPLFGMAPVASDTVQADAGPTEIPVFVRPGTVLTLLPRPIDSHYGAEAEGVSNLDDVAGERTLALYPAADGALESFDGSGWSAAPDWSLAAVDGAPLAECGDAPGSCRHQTGARVVGPGTLSVGDATLSLGEGTWHVAVARDAWGEWAEPTALIDLDPDIPPPCEAGEE